MRRDVTLVSAEGAPLETLLATINAAHDVFQNRHNWLSPLTTDEERKQFIARYCVWWNNVVCPAMDAIGAEWSEQKQSFELPSTSMAAASVQQVEVGLVSTGSDDAER